MADLSRDVVRSILNIQGFDPPEPEFTEVFYRINALIEGLVQLDQLDVYHTEPWPILPFSRRPPALSGGRCFRAGRTGRRLTLTTSPS